MSNKQHSRVEIEVEYVHQTENALRVSDGTNDSIWLPKSQIEYDEDIELTKGKMISVTMPDWLAEEKELV
jgi:hypothetical protein